MKRLLALLLAIGLGGCVPPPPWPVPVPVPPAPPVPPTPPNPAAGVATWIQVQQVAIGQTRAQVDAILGVAPVFDAAQDDGTRLVEWKSLGPADVLEYLDVHFNAAGVVIGRSRSPRASPPPVAVSDDDEIWTGDARECVGSNCKVHGR